MNTENKSSKSATTTGVLAALAASSCCIPPVIAAIAGIGGISSSLTWIEPLRPYLIGLAVVAIGYSWYAHLKPKKNDDCGCEINSKPKWYQTKGYLVGITLFAALATTFPYYSGIFFSNAQSNQTIVVKEENITKASLSIEGMTCNGCEHSVNSALRGQKGVVKAFSSYKTGKATVKFDKTKITAKKLASVVEKQTGYKVTDYKFIENSLSTSKR